MTNHTLPDGGAAAKRAFNPDEACQHLLANLAPRDTRQVGSEPRPQTLASRAPAQGAPDEPRAARCGHESSNALVGKGEIAEVYRLLELAKATAPLADCLYRLSAGRSEARGVFIDGQTPAGDFADRIALAAFLGALPEPPPGSDTRLRITFGEHHRLGPGDWIDRKEITWPEFCEIATHHREGLKEGPCFAPATFRGASRRSEDAEQIDILVFDSDNGQTLEEIDGKIRRRGWMAVVASTHSHKTTLTKASNSHWAKHIKANPTGTAEDFLTREKGYLARVAQGAAVDGNDENFTSFRHQPCPKFRICLLLARPWRASDYPNQSAANAAWVSAYKAAAAALGLFVDESGADPNRLFFKPRHPRGVTPVSRVIAGVPCDVWSLSAEPAPARISRPTSGASPSPSAPTEYVDGKTGEVIPFDCAEWAKGHGARFKIVDALRVRAPGALRGKISDKTKHHIECPFLDEHTNPDPDLATFVVNAGESTAPGKGFTVHCRHAHCERRDRLDFLAKMLSDWGLKVEDLTDPAFLLPEPDPIEAAVARLNQHQAVARVGGKTLILIEGRDPEGKPIVTFERAHDRKIWHLNDRVWDGNKLVAVFDRWLSSPTRRDHEGVDFSPGRAPGAKPGGFYNLWRGFSVDPDPRASCRRFLEHIRDSACCGDEALFRWLLGWFAHMVQRPEERPETSVVFIGSQGTGKTIIGKWVGALFPAHHVSVSQKDQLLGKFNAHLKHALLIQAEEAFWAGRKDAEGALKDLITSDVRMVELKGVDVFPVRNHSRLLITSNERFVVPAALEERRFAVFEFSDNHAQDRAYFRAITDEMENGGLGALLHVLQTFDLSTLDVRSIPRTDALLGQKLANLKPIDAWWLACLQEGTVAGNTISGDWPEDIATQDLYSAYKRHAREVSNDRYPVHEAEFGRWLSQSAAVRKYRPSGQPRRYCYRLPTLGQARTDFEKRIGHAIPWNEE